MLLGGVLKVRFSGGGFYLFWLVSVLRMVVVRGELLKWLFEYGWGSV